MGRASYEYPLDDPEMSRQLAEADKYRKISYRVGIIYGIELSIIAGICSRESRWGLALSPPGSAGTGDFAPRLFLSLHRDGPLPPDGFGFGRGLMQIDYDYHEFARTGNWRDPEENICYGIKLLSGYLHYFERRTDLDKEVSILTAIAAYNAGPRRILRAIRSGLNFDLITTGGDYSRDVLRRAKFFRDNGWI